MIKMRMDAEKVYENLKNAVTLSKDLRPILMKIRGSYESRQEWTVIGSINKNFITQSYYGNTWKDLTEDYAKRKAKDFPGKTILIRTGALFNSLVRGSNDGVNILTKTSLDYGTTIPYAQFHLTGTSKMSKRKFMGISENQKRMWYALIGKYCADVMNGVKK